MHFKSTSLCDDIQLGREERCEENFKNEPRKLFKMTNWEYSLAFRDRPGRSLISNALAVAISLWKPVYYTWKVTEEYNR